jgi:transposase
MAQERLSMQQTREILRQKWQLGRSHRQVAASLHVSAGAVAKAVTRAKAMGLQWGAVEALTDDELERRLYGPTLPSHVPRPEPDPKYLHVELRKPGVTLELLHLEYLERHPDGLRYSAFCERYRLWRKRQNVWMRQEHRAGEKMLVDFAGKKPAYVDPETGEVMEAELFVAVLGASNLTYVEATRTQTLPEWIAAHNHAVRYFGGMTVAVVPDQTRTAVSRPCFWEPELNRTYLEWAQHHDTVIVPARPKHPRDKAQVEVGVLIAERWILARLRRETHYGLDSLNRRIAELVEDLNARLMKLYGKTRRELFDEIERAALRPLPPTAFVFAEWKHARVNLDYHVELDRHYYSVPHPLVHEHVDVRYTATTVEIFLRGQRVASHARSYVPHKHTTLPEHMPKSHRAQREAPWQIVDAARRIGSQTLALVEAILKDRPHPEQGYRSCQGILRLGKRYGDARLEAACGRALLAGARSYRHVDSILKNGLDQTAVDADDPPSGCCLVVHENIRGRGYYQ